MNTRKREDITAQFPNINSCIVHGKTPRILAIYAGRQKAPYFIAVCECDEYGECGKISDTSQGVVDTWNHWNTE